MVLISSGPCLSPTARIVQQYGEAPDEDDLNAEQRLVFDAWQQAEAAALEAVLGPYRNLDEGGYEISPL